MKRIEVVRLVAVVKALCPSQKFEEITPDAWAMVLADVAYEDAQAAVQRIYREQGDDNQWIRQIEADDIIRQVKRDRSGRDKVACYICGRTRAQCEQARHFEISNGLPDPHHFESEDQATLKASRRQLAERETRKAIA
jgi:hypothetical protein